MVGRGDSASGPKARDALARRRVGPGSRPARRRRRRSRSAAGRRGVPRPRPASSPRSASGRSARPTACAAARSVAMPSPIMIASAGSRPTACAAASSRYGAGLPIETGTTPVATSSSDDDRAGTGSQPALGRVDRVAVGGDEMGARPDAVRGDHQPQRRSGSGRARPRPRRGCRPRRSRRSTPGSSGSRPRPRSTTS